MSDSDATVKLEFSTTSTNFEYTLKSSGIIIKVCRDGKHSPIRGQIVKGKTIRPMHIEARGAYIFAYGKIPSDNLICGRTSDQSMEYVNRMKVQRKLTFISLSIEIPRTWDDNYSGVVGGPMVPNWDTEIKRFRPIGPTEEILRERFNPNHNKAPHEEGPQ